MGRKITEFVPISQDDLNNRTDLMWVVGDTTGLLYNPTLQQLKAMFAEGTGRFGIEDIEMTQDRMMSSTGATRSFTYKNTGLRLITAGNQSTVILDGSSTGTLMLSDSTGQFVTTILPNSIVNTSPSGSFSASFPTGNNNITLPISVNGVKADGEGNIALTLPSGGLQAAITADPTLTKDNTIPMSVYNLAFQVANTLPKLSFASPNSKVEISSNLINVEGSEAPQITIKGSGVKPGYKGGTFIGIGVTSYNYNSDDLTYQRYMHLSVRDDGQGLALTDGTNTLFQVDKDGKVFVNKDITIKAKVIDAVGGDGAPVANPLAVGGVAYQTLFGQTNGTVKWELPNLQRIFDGGTTLNRNNTILANDFILTVKRGEVRFNDNASDKGFFFAKVDDTGVSWTKKMSFNSGNANNNISINMQNGTSDSFGGGIARGGPITANSPLGGINFGLTAIYSGNAAFAGGTINQSLLGLYTHSLPDATPALRMIINELGQVGIGTGPLNASGVVNPAGLAASATLQINSTTRGILIPRLTEAQKLNMATAIGAAITDGTLIYNSDTHRFEHWNGTSWATLGSGGTSTIGITIDGSGGPVTTGLKGYTRIPYNATIVGWSIISFNNTVITFDIWKRNNNKPLVADTIINTGAGGVKPNLNDVSIGSSTSLTGWTTSIQAGDVIGWNLEANSNTVWAILQLTIVKT